MQPPEDVYRLCSAQHGLLARRQLVTLVGRFDADHLLAGSRFERLLRGVYRVRGGAAHPHQRAIAATLRSGTGATLTGPAALGLLDLEAVDLGPGFHVVVPGGRRVTGVDFGVRIDPDPDRSVWHLGEVRIADAADALVEAAARSSGLQPRALRLAHDRLRWTDRLRPGQLKVRAERLRLVRANGSGRGLLGELLEMDASLATGDGERALARILSHFDPPAELQVWISPRHCLDSYFRTLRFAIEYQGRADHATEAGRSRDRVRDEELTMAGIRLMYVTAEDLLDERALLARIGAALTARADELGLPAPRYIGG